MPAEGTQPQSNSLQPEESKPDLWIDDGNLTIPASRLAEIIAKSRKVFHRAGPVRIDPNPDGGLPAVTHLNKHRNVIIAHELARPVKLIKEKNGEKIVPLTLPNRVAELYLALPKQDLTHLKGVTGAPLVADDGSIRSVQDYDTSTRLYCANIPDLSVPERPTKADAERALKVLRETFKTFSFADAQRMVAGANQVVDLSHAPGIDESSFLIAMLTSICRPSLEVVPGLALSAPTMTGAGTGKGKLARATCEIAYGLSPAAMTSSGDPKEFEKRIDAALIAASPVLFIDNANNGLPRSDKLTSVLTEPRVSVRPLGVSENRQLTPCSYVIITGNGLRITEDLARRFLVCELDAKMEDPEQRQFERGFMENVITWRGELLTAALTIWRWGRQKEGGLSRGRTLGSFEQWCRWVRDPLLTLGCADPVERVAAIKASDPERMRMTAIFTAWHEKHGSDRITAADLHETVSELMCGPGASRQAVANAVRNLAGTRAAGLRPGAYPCRWQVDCR